MKPADDFQWDRYRDGLKDRFDQYGRRPRLEDHITYDQQARLMLRAMGGAEDVVSRIRRDGGYTHTFSMSKKRLQFSFWRKARSFARAIWSFIRYGDISIKEHDRRMLICNDCEHVIYAPITQSPTNQFCGACECPRSPLSDLRTKCRMRDAKCPIDKW